MKKVIFGILLLLAAVFIILSATGVDLGFISFISVTDLVLSAIFLAFVICMIIGGPYGLIPFALMLWFFLLESSIAEWVGMPGQDVISNWLVFGCAVLATVGISLICGGSKQKGVYWFKGKKNSNKTFASDEIRYIDCNSFTNYYYKVDMGNGTVYFENPESYKGGGRLEVECRMGNLDIYIPNGWRIVPDIQNSMGNVDYPRTSNANGPAVHLIGKCKMGNISIHYR